MKRMVILLFVGSLVTTIFAARLPGDIDGDGTVGFSDFLLLASNFGETGGDNFNPNVSDTTFVEVLDTIRVTAIETLQVQNITVYDTVIVGRETVRFLPPPPPNEITQALKISETNLLTIRIFDYLVGEIKNENDVSISSIRFRLTGRDPSGLVTFTQQFSGPSILVAKDTRPIKFSLDDDQAETIRNGNFTIDVNWTDTAQKVNDVSLRLKENSIRIGSPFAISGEIENTSDRNAKFFEVVFIGKDQSGRIVYHENFRESTFGIPPGGSSPFSISEVALDYGGPYFQRSDLTKLFYYIRWQWSTSGYSDYEERPYNELSLQNL